MTEKTICTVSGQMAYLTGNNLSSPDKKIFIFNGDPRATGPAATLNAEFMRGASNANKGVRSIYLEGFRNTESYLVDNDDPLVNPNIPSRVYDEFAGTLKWYLEADIVVLVSTQYNWMVSNQLLKGFNKFSAVGANSPENVKKDIALIVTGQGEDFSAIEAWYESLQKHLGYKDLGKIIVPNVTEAADVKASDAFAAAYALGQTI